MAVGVTRSTLEHAMAVLIGKPHVELSIPSYDPRPDLLGQLRTTGSKRTGAAFVDWLIRGQSQLPMTVITSLFTAWRAGQPASTVGLICFELRIFSRATYSFATPIGKSRLRGKAKRDLGTFKRRGY